MPIRLVCLGLVLLVGCGSDGDGSGADASLSQAQIVARGKYLAQITGCDDCHTPWNVNPSGPAGLGMRLPDEALAFSGHQASVVMPAPPACAATAPWAAMVRGVQYTAWAGSFGVAFAANLTPDPTTGWLEGWSDQDFISMIRTGRAHSNTRDLAGPMLRVSLRMRKATDDDLKAIWAYLRSLPAKSNKVPDFISATQ